MSLRNRSRGVGIPVAIREFLRLHTWRGVPVRAALIAGLALALFLGSSAGAVSAARESLPGSPLYGLRSSWSSGHSAAREHHRLYRAGEHAGHPRCALTKRRALSLQGTLCRSRWQRVSRSSWLWLSRPPIRSTSRSGYKPSPEISETLQHQIRTMAEITARVKGEIQ